MKKHIENKEKNVYNWKKLVLFCQYCWLGYINFITTVVANCCNIKIYISGKKCKNILHEHDGAKEIKNNFKVVLFSLRKGENIGECSK